MPLVASGPLSQRGDLLVMEPGERGREGLGVQMNSQLSCISQALMRRRGENRRRGRQIAWAGAVEHRLLELSSPELVLFALSALHTKGLSLWWMRSPSIPISPPAARLEALAGCDLPGCRCICCLQLPQLSPAFPLSQALGSAVLLWHLRQRALPPVRDASVCHRVAG